MIDRSSLSREKLTPVVVSKQQNAMHTLLNYTIAKMV